MGKFYLIPHNYKNNGRVFNMFDKKKLTLALVWFIPVVLAIFNLPLSLEDKIFWTILIGFPPAIAILAGYGDLIKYFIIFMRNRRLYYDVKRGGSDEFVYIQYKNKKAQGKATDNT